MSQTYKVVLLGEGRVGKTSLVSRFVNDQFSPTEASTVQANMYNKKKVEVDGQPVDISIWDTAGQERFHALGPIYYRNSNGAVLVYDITDADTFEKVKMWIRELRKVVGDNIQLVICGNKGDMEKERDVELAAAEKYAKQQNALHFTTSAKSGMNVAEAFTALATAIVKANAPAETAGIRAGGSKKKRGGVMIDTEGTGANTAETVEVAPPPQHSNGGKSTTTTDKSYDYDDKVEPASTGPAKPPRKNTISLAEPRAAPQSSNSESGGAAGGGKSGKKKEGGCCK